MQKEINTNFKIEKEKLPPSGITFNFVSLLIFENDQRSDDSRLYDDSIREFEVKITLTKNFNYSDKGIIEPKNNDGNSYFLLPRNVHIMKVESSAALFEFYKNAQNEISLIIFRCSAQNWELAVNKLHEEITPLLDFFSYALNCPVGIDKIYCLDKKNDLIAVNYTTPYFSAILKPEDTGFPKDLGPIYALYREAKNNVSHFYKFLCYYKILEGIFKYLRPRLMSEARKKNIEIKSKKELVPDNSEYSKEHKLLVGKPIKLVFEKELTKEYRNTVAHYLTHEKGILNVSDYKTNKKFISVILLSELCCREVIDTHNYYIKQIR